MSVPLQSPASPALVSSRGVPAFLRHVRERGGDVDRLRARFGLPLDVERLSVAGLSPAALLEFGSACAAASNDPSIGFSAARRAPRGAFGLFEFALRTAPSLREAFARLGRYGRLVAPWAKLVVEADRPGFTRVSEQLLGLPHGLGRESQNPARGERHLAAPLPGSLAPRRPGRRGRSANRRQRASELPDRGHDLNDLCPDEPGVLCAGQIADQDRVLTLTPQQHEVVLEALQP